MLSRDCDGCRCARGRRPPRLSRSPSPPNPSISSSPMRRAAPATSSRASSPTSSGRARTDGGGGEPRRRERRDRRHVGRQCAARRPHAAGRADRRDRGQPVLDEGTHLRSEGTCAGRARDRRAARAHGARQGALRDHGRDVQGDADIRQAVLVRLRRHRHARPFRRRISERKAAGQARARALQGRGPGAERHHRRPCRHVFSRAFRR